MFALTEKEESSASRAVTEFLAESVVVVFVAHGCLSLPWFSLVMLTSRSLIELQIPHLHGVGHLEDREGRRERAAEQERSLVRAFRVPGGGSSGAIPGAGRTAGEVTLAEDATAAVGAESFARRETALADDADEAGGVVDVVCRRSYYQLLTGKQTPAARTALRGEQSENFEEEHKHSNLKPIEF